MNCKEFKKIMGDYVNRTLGGNLAGSAEIHLSVCPKCASLVRDLESTTMMTRSLDRTAAPVGFEERLKARMAARGRECPPWRSALSTALRSLFLPPGHRLAARPAIVGLLICFLIAGSIFVVNQRQSASEMDWAYIHACQDQHATFAGTNPLADESAVALRERVQDLSNEL